jgi:amino acid transporter/mannitol/fructose-specific phosphotransferase system IIA component (Ntr-type)
VGNNVLAAIARENPLASLERKLGFLDVFCIASGAMISSGLFVLPGLAYKNAGPAMVLSYALAAVMAIPAAMAQAELASAMPRSGGSYFFVERSMGALPGTLAGLANWLSLLLKSAFALVGIGAFADLVIPGAGEGTMKLVAIAFCAFFAGLNCLSVKHTGRLQVWLVAFLCAVLGVFIFTGMPHVTHSSFEGFMRTGKMSVFATAGLVFVSFGGLTQVASVAGEVRKPGRNLPAGMFTALFVVSLLYVAAVFVTEGVLRPEQLYDPAGPPPQVNLTPLSTAAGAFLGTGGAVLLALGAMTAFITTANSGILTASRSPMAMSQDGLLPRFFRVVSARFGTPYVSVLLTSAFMVVIIAALTVEDLVKVASTMMILLFALSNLAVLIMRRSRIQNYRPMYRCPAYPWLQLAGIAVYVLLVIEMGSVPILTTAAFAAAGVLWYFIYVRASERRESALVYMVRSAVSRDMYRSGLEDELLEIALERDEVIRDRFDRLVENCEILDIAGATTCEELFERAAEKLAGRIDVAKDKLCALLKAREAETSTVISPGLAIPHVVVPGQKVFDILPVRCVEGVRFPRHDEPVRMAFVLVGSADERNYHLRALMAIAHMVQEPMFASRWMSAPKAEHLRDLMLLSNRERSV